MAEFDYEVVNGRKIRVRPQEVVSEIGENGYFVRQPNHFTEGFGEEKNPVEKGRYHLVWAKLCHWSNRASIVRELLGLEDAISVNMVDHAKHEKNLGWEFVYDKDHIDPVLGIQFLSEAYYKADDDYTGRTTVPALIDTKTGKVVNNDYTWLTNYFEVDFKPFHKKGAPDLYPEELRKDMIEIKNISKTFKNNKVLDGIDLTINQGDVVAIIGPSGTGKSTFLRCVDRLEKPETGTITIDGETQDLAHIHGKDLTELRKKTGMVFQNFNLFSKKTALQNVMEGLIVVKKMKKEEAERIAREQLKNVGLLDHANHYPRHMSGGQQQRVAIARALAMEPKLLLLDEPTSALDPELVGEVLDTIKKAANEGYTMLLVSHEMSFVRNVATRVIFLDGGKILEDGTPREVFGNPKNERVKEFFTKINRMEEPDYSI